MPTTPRLGLPYPDDSNQNDVTLDLENLAVAIEAVDGQSLLASRPAAGVVGRRWYVTDNNVSGGFFYDTGTIWLRVTPSPWVSWTPTVQLNNGGGAVAVGTTLSDSAPVYRYRLLPGSTVQVHIEGLITLSGTQQFVGIAYSSPIPSAVRTIIQADAMNDIARASVQDAGGPFGNCILIYPNGGYNSVNHHWNVDGFNRYVFIDGIYPI